MLIPLVSFLLGFVLLGLSFLSYTNHPSLKRFPSVYQLTIQPLLMAGISCIAITLMLGMVGYFGYIAATPLRTIRIALGIIGIFLLSISFLRKINFKMNRQLNLLNPPGNHLLSMGSVVKITMVLTILSTLVLTSIFLISFFDANYGGDAFMYHIPFAARIWGIISPEQFTFEKNIEHRFLGFPLLANWLQGFFWNTFQRPEATNLLCYFSLLTFIAYLTFYIKIPFYLASLSLLAIPMVHMHAARSYIDLPGNVCISILILTTYFLYTNKVKFNKQTAIIIFISSATAANMKFQLIPVVFLILCFILPKIILPLWKAYRHDQDRLTKLSKTLFVCFLASFIIFLTPIKNTIIYANPFYPVKVEIAGIVLNHNEAPPDFMHENIRKLPRHLRWGRSVLEIDVFDSRRPWPWTLGMDFISWDEERFGLGGYFGGYVIFNLLLFVYLCWQNFDLESRVAAIIMGLMTLFTPLLPQAYELRYYMYWMMVFVSLNCYLTCRLAKQKPSQKLINPRNLGLVAAVFMVIFITKTRYFFTIPEFASFDEQVKRTDIIDQDILRSIKDGEKVCIVGKAPHPFLYTSYFHPPYEYSVKAEFDVPEFVEEGCKGRRILR
ncbi:unknown [Crocosphaera subtropica ATCC 51142]|uniref:Glycosyltransferase RgtA/B/C/D-like domain-containing protein n=1 Tax=Crocosphaera subtropica (strain ATCC 51142 / BH68) TaxID=43989 RepID=B1WP96_CROS5|nr:hypothetical protein [Crocosphaera subtropica]ACB49878.1 unknown [Crocosphaera subtropica ATCC 51142]